MSVRWDPLLAAALARELNLLLGGSRVRALTLDATSRRLLLYLREHTLVFELHPQAGWVSLLPPSPPPEGALRLAGRVREVRSLPDESSLVLEVAEKGGGGSSVEVVVEWIGTRWNAFVLESGSRIIRHLLLTREEGSRILRTGTRFESTPSTGRRGVVRDLTDEEWQATLEGEAGKSDPRSALLRSIAWVSGVNVSTLLSPEGWARWLEMTAPEQWGGWILGTERGLQPYPYPLDERTREEVPTLLEAFRIAREREEGEGSTRGLLVPRELLEAGDRRLHRLRGRMHRLRKELEAIPDPAPLRMKGDLLLARWGEVPSGKDRMTLPGFEGDSVEILLDPALRPDENAARYYREAGRAERALATLPDRIRRAGEEIDRWSGILEGVREGRLPADRLARALGHEGEGMAPGSGSKGGKTAKGSGARKGVKAGDPLPYRRYSTSGGLEVRVGKGARQNDDLTFRHSSPNDVWLHAGQSAGAHVILRWDREGNPPKRDLEEAGILAALNSGARHSKTVAVTWTRRKYVRKPRKAPPGTVGVERVQTLFVEPDEDLPEKLTPEE